MSTDATDKSDKSADSKPAEGETRLPADGAAEGGKGGLWLAGLLALVVGGVVMLAFMGLRGKRGGETPAAAAGAQVDPTVVPAPGAEGAALPAAAPPATATATANVNVTTAPAAAPAATTPVATAPAAQPTSAAPPRHAGPRPHNTGGSTAPSDPTLK